MNNTDRFWTVEPLIWLSALVSSKLTFSLLTSNREDDTPTLYPVIPLNPRIQPVKKNLSLKKANLPVVGLFSVGFKVVVMTLSTVILSS